MEEIKNTKKNIHKTTSPLYTCIQVNIIIFKFMFLNNENFIIVFLLYSLYCLNILINI